MRIRHHIVINAGTTEQKIFESVGIELKLEVGASVFQIYEDDSKWPEVENIIRHIIRDYHCKFRSFFAL